MQPEPTNDAVAATQQFLDGQPAQQQPEPPTPQPAPSQQPTQQPANDQPLDPFASMFDAANQTPTEPAAPPTQPTESAPEPTQPQQPQQPVEPSQPQQPAPQEATQPQVAPSQEEDYQTFDEYMNNVTKEFDNSPELPDVEKIDPNDPQAIKKFFDDLVTTAVRKAEQSVGRKSAIQAAERQAWDGAFNKYPSLKTNKPLRDMVHNMRMGYFQRGQAITPVQAANKVLEIFNQNYKKGITDNQVQTKIEQVQPNSGGGTPVETTLDRNQILSDLQTGGEQALASYLDSQIKSGKL